MRILLTGATGYIGGRLARRLLRRGHELRCLVRHVGKMSDRPWAADPRVEIIEADLEDAAATTEAMRGCGPAYYLVHSMLTAGRGYAERDRRLAVSFAEAAARTGIERIIYLGGLGELSKDLSEHLASRRQVESALASGPVPVTAFRAAAIIGSGSASFETLRYLVERLPVMPTPACVDTECQPIAIRNVLGYLTDCLDLPETIGRTFDLGGADIVTYRELIRIIAEELGLRRRIIIPVPFISPNLCSFWIHLLTPMDRRITRPLADGLRNRVVARDDAAQRLMPQPLLTPREAVREALRRMEPHEVETFQSVACAMPGDPHWAGGAVYMDERTTETKASPDDVFRTVRRIGGRNGWYAVDWIWALRGAIDRLWGGPGLRRGRRDPERITRGEALDFWRVVYVERPRRLTLRAEMKVPGEAHLDFRIDPHGSGARITQTARFRPRGLVGILYWYAVMPFHGIVFRGMLRGIRRRAERADGDFT